MIVIIGSGENFETGYSALDPIITDHQVYGYDLVPGSLHLARHFLCDI